LHNQLSVKDAEQSRSIRETRHALSVQIISNRQDTFCCLYNFICNYLLLQNKEKMLISKTIGKNGSVKEVMLWFSSLRAEGEAI